MVAAVLSSVVKDVTAQTLTTLASFNGANGQYPNGDLTLSGSTLYGMTSQGGANGYGNVFSISTSGSDFWNLLSFNVTNGDDPEGSLTLNGSTLYGTTTYGGDSGFGEVFSLSVSGGAATNMHSFNGDDGAEPHGSLTLSGSTLYGTTYSGSGVNYYGSVFSMPVTGGAPTTLLSFSGTGGFPLGNLTIGGTTLYGMTSQGGADDRGTVFSVPVSGGTATTLLTFNFTNGAIPHGSLTLSGSTLYGMTYSGGSLGSGTVFSLPVSGGTVTTLANTASPSGSLTLSGSTLYGMASGAGTYGYGAVFSIPVSGGTLTTLFSFNRTDGAYPHGSLTLSGSTLYGMTTQGGANDDGTVFALNIAPATIALASSGSATIISGGSATLGMTVSNSPSSGCNLNYTLSAAVVSGSAALGTICSGTGSLAPGGSQSCTVSATSTTLGVTTISFTGSDPNSSNLSQTSTATLTVLDHAAAAFANGSTVLNLSFGTVQRGTHAVQFQIENLPAAYRAGLDLDSVTALSDPLGVFSTDAMPFSDLASGAESGFLDLFLNETSQDGQFSGQYQFNLSDEQDLSGHAGQQTLTLNVTANVVPEPSTLALLGVGAMGLLACAWLRRQSSRSSAAG